MKKQQAGFTLIELIIVIVILGILAATAAPRFFDFSGDARTASLEAIRSSLETASTSVFGKAAIHGLNRAATGTLTADQAGGPNPIPVVFGYPQATGTTLQLVADFPDGSWTFTDGTGSVAITPDGFTPAAGACSLTYTAPTAVGTRPTIAVVSTGC